MLTTPAAEVPVARKSLLRGWFAIPLWKRVFAGLALGVLLGLVWPAHAPQVAFLGEIFVRLIKMLVAPIVLLTITAGVTELGDPKRLGSLGGRTIGVFLCTTVVGVSIGMAVGMLVHPGVGANLGGAIPRALGAPKTVVEQLIGIVPVNIVDALAKGDMLAIIFVAILLGAGTISAGAAGRPLADFFQSASAVMLRVVTIAMEATPFGVFGLVANSIAANGVAVFVNVGWLALCVAIGVVVQVLLVHTVLIRLVARLKVAPFLRAIRDPLMVAFSTASSTATLPVAMRVAQDKLGINKPVFMTVLPLGTAIGKDGTAMYVGLISMFSLQALGIELAPASYLLVLVTATLAAFGSAPVPSASLFMLAAVLAAVGTSVDQTALVVGFVLPFDRLMDMTRTVSSASANLAVSTTVARMEGELDEAVYSGRGSDR